MTRTSLVLRMMVPHFGHTHRRVLLLALGGFGAPVWLLPGPLLAVPVAAHICPRQALCHLDILPAHKWECVFPMA